MPSTNEAQIQVLIITGEVTGEHDPKVSSMLRRMLESTGRFKVKITEEFRGASAETLAPYDLVLVNYDGGDGVMNVADPKPVRLGERAEKAILDFVSSGKGVVFYHSSVFATVWPKEFLRMMGGYCDMAAGSRRAPGDELAVKVDTGKHPITAGLKPSWTVTSEDLFAGSFWHPEAKVEVLATVFDDIEHYRNMSAYDASGLPKGVPVENLFGVNKDQAVAWINQYGKGRAFVISIGHGPDTIKRVGFVGLFCRAAEWAATGSVTLPPPDVSGENRRRAWPYYSTFTVVEYASMLP